MHEPSCLDKPSLRSAIDRSFCKETLRARGSATRAYRTVGSEVDARSALANHTVLSNLPHELPFVPRFTNEKTLLREKIVAFR